MPILPSWNAEHVFYTIALFNFHYFTGSNKVSLSLK